MNKYVKHFVTVTKHKWVVFKECAACGIVWQGIVHDLSKYSPTEFVPSARYFQGDKSPIEKEKAERGYSAAWLHHKGHNKHHWEYWTDFDKQGNIVANPIPRKYIVEMVCDWIGAGKVYSGDKWTQSSPWEYYNKVRAGRHFAPEVEQELVGLLAVIASNGLDRFHTVAKWYLRTKIGLNDLHTFAKKWLRSQEEKTDETNRR